MKMYTCEICGIVFDADTMHYDDTCNDCVRYEGYDWFEE